MELSEYLDAMMNAGTGGIEENRSERYAGVIMNAGQAKRHRNPVKALYEYVSGDTYSSDIRQNGVSVDPLGNSIAEVDTSGVYDGINKVGSNVLEKPTESFIFDVDSVGDEELRNVFGGIYDKVKGVEYDIDTSLEGGKDSLFGAYFGQPDGGLLGNIAISSGDFLDGISNAIAHEGSHSAQHASLIGDDFLNRGTLMENMNLYGEAGEAKYNDRTFELEAQIGGNRHLYDQGMIKDVHQYIDYVDGKFNVNPAKEMLRRAEVSELKSGMDKADTERYMVKLQDEADMLNERVGADKVFRDKMDRARWNDGDIYDWRDQ